MNYQFALNILSFFGSLSLIIAGIGFAYAQFMTGSIKAKDELIKTLGDTADAERDKAKREAEEKRLLDASWQKQFNELTKEVGNLQGKYTAIEKEKATYLQILQGRNPEQDQFMKMMISAVTNGQQMQAAAQKYMTDSQKYMADSVQVLAEIRTFMAELNKRSVKTEEFQQSVVVATKQETGKPLRKEV